MHILQGLSRNERGYEVKPYTNTFTQKKEDTPRFNGCYSKLSLHLSVHSLKVINEFDFYRIYMYHSNQPWNLIKKFIRIPHPSRFRTQATHSPLGDWAEYPMFRSIPSTNGSLTNRVTDTRSRTGLLGPVSESNRDRRELEQVVRFGDQRSETDRG